jgi:hypothetical protein
VGNTIGIKCELNKKTSNKGYRIWDDLCVLHPNIRSLSGKCAEFKVLLESDVKNVDVLCFTEHWLNSQKVSKTQKHLRWKVHCVEQIAMMVVMYLCKKECRDQRIKLLAQIRGVKNFELSLIE